MAPLVICAADDPYAAALFQKHCASCHQSEAGATGRIPQISVLKAMTPIAIQKTLESGVMKTQAAALSGDERVKLANFLGTAVTVQRKREEIANPCPAGAAWGQGPSWASWGGGLANARFQDAKGARLEPGDLPRLKLKWAFAFPDTSALRSQPAVYRGRVFAGGQDGSVFALDAATGCVHWTTAVQSQVRSGITVGEIAGNPALFFGDSAGYVYALDGASGKQLWKLRPDEHPAETVTATPVYHQGRLYVGVASREEALSVAPGYMCCTFRGSESAVDAATGKVLWKRYMIAEVAKQGPKTKLGAATSGPSGAGVWTAPTLDPDRDTMYVTSGDNYSDPPSAMSDALVALRMSTGEVLWSKQFTAKDAWNSSCQLPGKVNCPDSDGPDFDFAAPAILVNQPNGKRVLLLGQKSAVVYAVDPDKKGQILWQSRIGEGGTVGGIEWGTASDGRNVYVALSDIRFQVGFKPGSNDRTYDLDPNKGGGMFAFRVDNGERMWQTPPPGCGDRRPCSPAQSAAVTATPGLVWSGAEDGHLRAYSTANGKILWDYDTAHEYKAVNGIPARGGAIDVAGPVVAGGMVLTLSGYPARGGLPGNVLLAFAIER
ncbi:MAG TPA: PQQ-binding-like beta-propeller repeat protein [Bryobacteraceae bacterium]|jgi:polyvinyl alcohol dehydrogenase (cytochrome)|nr:PQQ-binding-like beta-propeller repeat protein [Bryobacteraceae bacterium]